MPGKQKVGRSNSRKESVKAKRSSMKASSGSSIPRKSNVKGTGAERSSSVKFNTTIETSDSRRKSFLESLNDPEDAKADIARTTSAIRFQEDAAAFEEQGRRKSSLRFEAGRKKSMFKPSGRRQTLNPSRNQAPDSLQDLEEDEEEEDEGEEEEEEEISIEEPDREFYGSTSNLDLIDRRKNIVQSLKTRNWAKEQRSSRTPTLTVKHIDLNLTNERKIKILQVFPMEVLRRLDKRLPTVDHEVLTDYELQLPPVGPSRYKTLGKPARTKLKTKPRIVMPDEGPVKNPFFIPDNVPQYMIQHEQERVEQRARDAGVPTKEKLNAKTLMEKVVADRVKPYLGEDAIVDAPTLYNTIKWEAGLGLSISHIQKASRKLHANYLTNRKNLFYAEYCILAREKALDKIRLAEEAEEAALKNYEYLSNYTANSLEIFLKENEELVSSAARAAEDICKENIDLLNQGRNLRYETANMKAEIVGLNDRLREFKYYMQFLDGVTKEFMRKDDEDRFRTDRRQQQIKEELTVYLKRGYSLKQALAAIKKRNKKYIGDRKPRSRKSSMESESAEYLRKLQDQMKTQAMRPPVVSKITSLLQILSAHAHSNNSKFDEEALLWELDLVGGDEQTDREELGNLIFTRPEQLLNIYTEVKEHNVTISRRANLNEGILEELDNRIKNFRKESEVRARKLRDMVNSIELQMEKATEQIEVLNMLIDKFTGGYYDVKGQERMMTLLRKHVNQVYKSAIGNHDAHLSSVLMLTSIEKHFEDVVVDLESMPPEVVTKISADLEKERREAERIDQERQRLVRHNTRVNKSLVRAQAPIKRKKGLNLIFRSRPPRSAVHLTQKDLDKKAEADEWDYYFGVD